MLCDNKNGNLDDEVDATEVPKNVEETQQNQVIEISDNNVKQSDARKVIISITSSEEAKEES